MAHHPDDSDYDDFVAKVLNATFSSAYNGVDEDDISDILLNNYTDNEDVFIFFITLPEKPLEVQWKPLNTSSVRVMWKEPNVTNGQIRGYTVSYTKVFKLERWKNVTQLGTRPFTDKITLEVIRCYLVTAKMAAKLLDPIGPSSTPRTVTGLSPNTRYTLVVRAATNAGLGSPSEALELVIPARQRPSSSSSTPSSPPPQETNDQFLGILLGCSIGGICVVLCMVSLIYRRRCAKPGRGQCRTAGSNGTPCFHSSSEHHEMQCLPGHLDTKGGHPNNEVNGLRLPLLSNGRLPNGLVTRDRSVRITENPQFECGVTVSCEELRQPSDEGDSLLSGHSLNDTQQLAPTPAALAVCDKQEPDDGFHESHLPVVGPNG
ncbi:hypothetical protein J6590_019210 [Homalodisca vitripennis]|nr:hypothetical protein J6590_019210 [Homalodisca vitripennis]